MRVGTETPWSSVPSLPTVATRVPTMISHALRFGLGARVQGFRARDHSFRAMVLAFFALVIAGCMEDWPAPEPVIFDEFAQEHQEWRANRRERLVRPFSGTASERP